MMRTEFAGPLTTILSGVPPALLTVPSDTGPFLSAVAQLGGLVAALLAPRRR